jgi:M6 family metalloprotease-like protein
MARIRLHHRMSTTMIIRFLAITLTFSLAPISFIQEVSAAPIPVSECKLVDPFQSIVRLGFPRNKDRLSPTGAQKILLLAIDYSDAPTTENATEALKFAFDTDEINDFYKAVSYGQLSFTFDIHPTVVRMPKTSSNYVGKLGNTYPQPILVGNIMQDAAQVVSGQVNFSTYQAVAILDLGRVDAWGYWGFALPQPFPGFSTSTGYIRNSTVIGAWENKNKTLAKGYKTYVLKHELGHLFGFIDLYVIAPGNYFTGQTPGPFDAMNTNGPAHEFLAWQRWLQGWITDSNVNCLAFTDPTDALQLRPLGKASTGTQMTVIRVSSQKALVLESRRGTSEDELAGNDGLLAYEIDLSVPTLEGPIKIIPKNSAAALAPLSPDINDVDRYLDATAQTGEYIRYKDILIENLRGNQEGEVIRIYKGEAASTRQRELDNIKRISQVAEFNAIKAAKANNTYYESPTCLLRGQKLTFQTLDDKRVWKDLDVPIKSTTDATCSNALYTKPYIITQLPSRTFYRGKVTQPGTNMEWYSQIVITDAIPLNDKTQSDLEIALAKLEDNYYQESSACYSQGTTGTFQIERDGVFVDFAPVTWVQVKECSSVQSSFRPYAIARLGTGTKYRFKAQAPNWDRDYFTQVYTKAKTVPELLADVTKKSAELNTLTLTLGAEKAALNAQVSSLTQQVSTAKSEIEKSNTAKAALNNELSAIIATLRAEKTELEGSVATLTTQLVTSSAQIQALEEEMAKQRSSFESVSGELITAKSKLEGDVAFLQNANTTLQAKVNSLSKTTITCIKGSTQKKVTGVKPVCPAGYKKKS